MRSPPLRAAAILVAASLLHSDHSRGDDVLAVVGQNSTSDVQRLLISAGMVTPGAGSAIGVEDGFTVAQALPTRDGTDVMLLARGSVGGTNVVRLYRAGRTGTGTASTITGSAGYQGQLVDGVSVGPSGVSANLAAASWIGAAGRHLAVVTGSTTVSFYDTATYVGSALAAAVPGDWAGTPTTLTLSGYNMQYVAATPQALYLSDGSSTLKVVSRGGSGASDCLINNVAGSGADAVTALYPLADGRVAAAVVGGRLALLPAGGCSGGHADTEAEPGNALDGAVLSALTFVDGRVHGSGTNSSGDSVLASFAVGGSTTTVASDRRVSVLPTAPNGAIAAVVSSGTTYVFAGGNSGYQLYTFDGNQYSLVPGAPALPAITPALTQTADPAFLLSDRVIDLRSNPASTTPSYLRVYGVQGKALRVFPGTCRRTAVADAYSGANGLVAGPLNCKVNAECVTTGVCLDGTRCARPLEAGSMASGTYSFPAGGLPANLGTDALFAIQQLAEGEECSLIIACDADGVSPGGCAGRGGGAIVRVLGGPRALALVLDRSGSMAGQVGVSDPGAPADDPGRQIRQVALQNALDVLYTTLRALPADVQAAGRFAVVPFDDQSGPVLPASGAWTGAQLADPMNTATITANLTPRGLTNIRGGLRTAAERMTLDAAFAGVNRRSILLMTDGLHNRVGQPNENSMTTASDPVDNLTLATSFLKDTSWSAAGIPRVDRLYAVGLSQTTYHQSLLNLVSLMNRGVPTAGGAVPPGYINYADASRNLSAGNQLAQFFTKVLWDYLGYTEYVDPIVNVSAANVYSRTVQIAGANQVVLVVGWQNANAAVTASLINPATGQSIGACQRSTFSVACLADAGALKGLTSVEVRAFARLDTQVMIEVATRNTLRAEPRLPKLVYNTGDSIPFQVALRLAGLPIVANANTSIKVTASLVQPAGALGTVLGNAKVSAQAIADALSKSQDLTPAAAKLSLLGRDQLPGYRSPPTLELRDDGKSGDGAAGDGVFGVLVPANLPGLYQLTAQAAITIGMVTLTFETSMATQVAVRLSAKKTIGERLRFDPPAGDKTGTLVLRLTPQDAAGNLLGPGNGASLRFRQKGRLLPSQVDDAETLDGSYTATISGIRPGGGVILDALGSSDPVELIPVDKPGGDKPPVCDGCCCDFGHRSRGVPVGGLGVAVLLLGLALRRRRPLA